MSLEIIHLRKLLKIFYLSPSKRMSALRNDIREDIAKGEGATGGGDFYGPFWRDAKDHVFGRSDLHERIAIRIENNPRRERLYPLLRDGFLLWWNDRRRWQNEPFEPAAWLKGSVSFDDIGGKVKIDNILAVRDGQEVDHYIYPYFSVEPSLNEEAARLGIWLLIRGLPDVNPEEIRILDVIRGTTYSVDRNPLNGDEGAIFRAKYKSALLEWRKLWAEYE